MTMGGGPSVVTFLFTDLVGSTELTDSLGDEGAQEILRIHNAVVRTEVGRHAGSEVKTMGDGFMIAFRGPTSALACAVAIQRAIAQHNHEQPTREFMVRMGLNAGEAIQEEADFFGAAVLVAARIAALPPGGGGGGETPARGGGGGSGAPGLFVRGGGGAGERKAPPGGGGGPPRQE